MNNTIIAREVRLEIERRLNAIESDYGVKVLLACESGSRAWGFASDDSDYDVRFIYIQPTSWYLTVDLEDRRDVIETPIEGVWDINGWELRKALKLFSKSNPPLLEWLQSTINDAGNRAFSRSLQATATLEASKLGTLPPRKMTWQSGLPLVRTMATCPFLCTERKWCAPAAA